MKMFQDLETTEGNKVRGLPLFIFFMHLSVSAQDCIPEQHSCNYYLCLESKMQCGLKGYPLNYGYRFCNNFLNVKKLSSNGERWLTDTRKCLQEKVEQMSDRNCETLWKASIDDHVDCYIDNGYCELSKKDKKRIKKVVLKEMTVFPLMILKNIRAFNKVGCN